MGSPSSGGTSDSPGQFNVLARPPSRGADRRPDHRSGTGTRRGPGAGPARRGADVPRGAGRPRPHRTGPWHAGAGAAVAVPAGRQGDNLGVAGLLGGTALDVATAAPLAAVPLGLPAVMLLATMLARPRSGPDAPGGHGSGPRDTGVFW
ncbi:hypothetical protein [Actinomadura sp. 3N407]|uniref:hypothetical protein n=1 Tax=Actinomadura sp. 3N407 TaxID=3457423 RepID=UPI003FCCA51A